MTQHEIIRKLFDLVDDNNIVVKDEEYKKRNQEAGKWLEQLDKHINADEELQKIFCKYDMEDGLRESIAQEIYYREGFLCGARLALMICGYTKENR